MRENHVSFVFSSQKSKNTYFIEKRDSFFSFLVFTFCDLHTSAFTMVFLMGLRARGCTGHVISLFTSQCFTSPSVSRISSFTFTRVRSVHVAAHSISTTVLLFCDTFVNIWKYAILTLFPLKTLRTWSKFSNTKENCARFYSNPFICESRSTISHMKL